MKLQYGHVLTLLVVLTGTALGSSLENVMSHMSSPQLENFLQELDLEYKEEYNNIGGGPNYDYESDYQPQEVQPAEQRPLDAVAAMHAVPKPESQGPQLPANSMLPAYCEPPNPCPIGYTKADGCIEDFENTSEFSREFQATQTCICDTEHMFDCPQENAHRGQEDIAAVNFLAGLPGMVSGDVNPYMSGEKLSVAAKKGF